MPEQAANIFAGLTRGLTDGYHRNLSPEGRANRAEARVRQRQGEESLREIDMLSPSDSDLENRREIMSAELEQTKQEVKTANRQAFKQQVFAGFDRYTADYDIRHLNHVLEDARNNQAGQAIFGDIARVDRLTEADRDLIRGAELDPDLILNSETLQRQWLKVTDEDGFQYLQDVQETFVMTGYERYASNRELDRQLKAAQLHSDAQEYGTVTERGIARELRLEGLKKGTEEYERRFAELLQERTGSDGESGSRIGGTAMEREALATLRAEGITEGDDEFDSRFVEVMQELRRAQGPSRTSRQEREIERKLAAEGIEPGDPDYNRRYVELNDEIVERDRQTASSRDLDEVEDAKRSINQTAQEVFDTDFFSLDFNDTSIRLVFENEINRIERLGGLSFDAQDKQEFAYVKQLLSLGEPAQDLTDRETGLIDNVLRDVSRYISNNTDGTEARAAYNAFRNVLRHSLYGSVQTEENIRSFNDQFGSLSQQRGPVLSQFNTALRQLRGKLDGMRHLNDSYVVHYRLGTDMNHLDRIIESLDDEIQRFNNMQNQEPGPESSPTLSPSDIEGLDQLRQEIDSGAQGVVPYGDEHQSAVLRTDSQELGQ